MYTIRLAANPRCQRIPTSFPARPRIESPPAISDTCKSVIAIAGLGSGRHPHEPLAYASARALEQAPQVVAFQYRESHPAYTLSLCPTAFTKSYSNSKSVPDSAQISDQVIHVSSLLLSLYAWPGARTARDPGKDKYFNQFSYQRNIRCYILARNRFSPLE